MGETIRFGVSMDSALVELLDRLTQQQGHPNRSETLRHLVRQELLSAPDTNTGQTVIATLTLLYRHGTALPRLAVKEYPSLQISANLQLHVDGEICVKLMVMQGQAGDVHAWARRLLARKGVVGRLTIAATADLTKEL